METTTRKPVAQNRRTLPSAPRRAISVTKEIITNSTVADSSHCMISDAVKASVPGATYISVDIQTIRFTLDGFRYSYMTPRIAQIGLIKFDQGDKDIEPFAFQLRTGQTTRSGSRRAVKTGVHQPRTEKQAAATKHAMAQSTKGFNTEPAKLVTGSGQNHMVPEIRGGRTAPLAALPGGPGVHSNIPPSRRRQFGLRAMDKYVRPSSETES